MGAKAPAGKAGKQGKGKAAGGKRAKSGGGGQGWMLWLLLFMLLPMGYLVLPSVVLFAAGMVPTVVAVIAIRDSDGFEHLSIGVLNVAGVLPWLIQLWRAGHNFAAVKTILTDPVSWLVMFGAASVGWIIFAVVPPVVASIVAQYHQIAADRFADRRKKLIEEWGFPDKPDGQEQDA